MRFRTTIPLLSFLFFFFFAIYTILESSGDCSDFDHSRMDTEVGGIHDSPNFENSLEIESLARFAVDQHNTKQNSLLEFARVVKAREQIVAGTLHYLTLEAIDAGEKKIYEAKVWVKLWMNFKELTEFKHAGGGDGPSFTSSDLGVKKDGHKPGWQSVPTHDPHALKTIQQRSNSLVPYELHEVADAKAEVIDDSAKFNLLLKLKRGQKEEKFKVEVHKNNEGSFHLNQMEAHDS